MMARIAPAWLHDPATRAVMAALAPARPLFVGGCVRDALLGRGGEDQDIAVATPPEETLRLAAAAGLGAHPTGVEHGVVTIVADGRPFEAATLRRDVATDGRRAVVAWTEDVAEDAARRDFTLNALYADSEGRVIDPLGEGLADLRARRLRFVGDPAARIAEDYLRILRFFRFHATLTIGDFDPAGLAACLAAADGLAHVSKERIGAEMLKLLAAPDPEPALAVMGAALTAALPGAVAFAGLSAVEANFDAPPGALRRLVALGAKDVAAALRLSRADANRIRAIRAALLDPAPLAARAWRHGAEAARDALLLRAAQGDAPPPDWPEEIARAAAARFPVVAADLIARGATPGPTLGLALKTLEARWLASDLRASRATLLKGSPLAVTPL